MAASQNQRPAYEYLHSVRAPMLVLFDPFSRSYRFLYRQHSRWNLDTWLHTEILEGRARLYLGDFSYFTVIDDLGREVRYVHSSGFGNSDLLAGAIHAGPGVPESLGRFTYGRSPTDLDREFRDHRAQNEAAAAPPPPPPEAPGDGAVAVEGAESRQPPQAQGEPAQPALAALAVLAVADEGVPVGLPPAPPAEEQDGEGPVLLRALRTTAWRTARPNVWAEAMRAAEIEESWGAAAASLWNLPARLEERTQGTSALAQLLAVSALLDLSGGDAPLDPWSEGIARYNQAFGAAAAAPAPSTIPKPQKYVADLVIADKIKQGACCAITMEPLSSCPAGPACVAPCYHCFDKGAIQEWLARNDTCPECRQACSL